MSNLDETDRLITTNIRAITQNSHKESTQNRRKHTVTVQRHLNKIRHLLIFQIHTDTPLHKTHIRDQTTDSTRHAVLLSCMLVFLFVVGPGLMAVFTRYGSEPGRRCAGFTNHLPLSVMATMFPWQASLKVHATALCFDPFYNWLSTIRLQRGMWITVTQGFSQIFDICLSSSSEAACIRTCFCDDRRRHQSYFDRCHWPVVPIPARNNAEYFPWKSTGFLPHRSVCVLYILLEVSEQLLPGGVFTICIIELPVHQ